MQPDALSDIRDIKPLADVPLGPPWWLTLLIAGLAVAAVAAVFWWWRRRHRQETQATPTVPADEVALAELARLEDASIDTLAQRRRLHFQVSDVLRTYVEGCFGVNATDMTREEILAAMRERIDIADTERGRLSEFLTATDTVKFAKREPSEEDCKAVIETARGFVRRTSMRLRPAAERSDSVTSSSTPAGDASTEARLGGVAR